MGQITYRFSLILSLIIFFIVTIFALVLIYDAYLISKDGEFCYFRQQHEENYDFEFPKGYKCDFLLAGMLEPAIILISFNIGAQLFFWFMCGLFNIKSILLRFKFTKEKSWQKKK